MSGESNIPHHVQRYFDLLADVTDTEEEDLSSEEEDGFIDNSEPSARSAPAPKPTTSVVERTEIERLVREIQERSRTRNTQGREVEEEETFLGSESLGEQIDTVAWDGLKKGEEELELFMVRVQVGKERFYAERIDERLEKLWEDNPTRVTDAFLLTVIRQAQDRGENISLRSPSAKPSAFALREFPGRIYALCPNMAWFWTVCSCFPYISHHARQIRVYSAEERHFVLQARDKMTLPPEFEVGDWVKIQSGWYKDDLGRVREVNEEEDGIVVAVVPRIPSNRKRRRPRPNAHLFHPAQDFGKDKAVRLPGFERFMLRKRIYINGLAEIRYSHFQLSKAQPSLLDIGPFLETETSLGYLDEGEPFLQYGDKVIDLATGIRGRVSDVSEEVVTLLHKVDDQGKLVDIDEEFFEDSPDYVSQCNIKNIHRIIERGMQIRVMVGKLEGQVGIVLSTRKSERSDIVEFLSNTLKPLETYTRWVQTFHGHIHKTDEEVLYEEIIRTGECRVKGGPHDGVVARVDTDDIELGKKVIKLMVFDEKGEYVKVFYEPLSHLETVKRSENDRYRDPLSPDPTVLQPEKYRDSLKGMRIYVVRHSEYKGRFGYVLDTHPSNGTANIALDGYAGSKNTNDHLVRLDCLISVDPVFCLDESHKLTNDKISEYHALFVSSGEFRPRAPPRPRTPPNFREIWRQIESLLNRSSGSLGPLTDYTHGGLWLIHPKVLQHFPRYKIYFRLGKRSCKNWTMPNSAHYVDHSECERAKDHGFCRIHAEITDLHHTKVHRFEGVGMHRVTPHPPKKDLHVLVIDLTSSEFGQIFRMKKFKDRSMVVAQVLDTSNELREYQVSQLTMAEEIKE